MNASGRSRGPGWRAIASTAAAALVAGALPLGIAQQASAAEFLTGSFVSPTLEGCRGDTSGYVDDTLVCPDSEYTTGNLGKGWNELDLVPHRLTTNLGEQAGATTTYDLILAADNSYQAYEGYDFISVPEVNTDLSHASCQISSIAYGEQVGVTGGVDDAKYRQVRITQDKGTKCVFDYVERLSITAAEYSGSSLQSYLFEEADFRTGKRTVPIPVKEVEPQAISKTMSATQDSDHVWTIKKTAPATVNLGNTCEVDPATGEATIRIEWQKLPAAPSGQVTVVTTITAENPSRRAVQVHLTDVIYGQLPGATTESVLDTEVWNAIVVPANTTTTIATHTLAVPDGTTGLRDVATAAYTDVVFPDVAIQQDNTATASATVQSSGVVTNGTAVITDVEELSGTGLDFKVAEVAGASGSFQGYTLGDWTDGPVTWVSGTQSGDGSVTFSKVLRAAKGSVEPEGRLADAATLVGSDGFQDRADATTKVAVNTLADLTISKTIDDVLQGSETATFGFDVYDSTGTKVTTEQVAFAAGETSKSVVVQHLAPDAYTVKETPAAGFTADADKTVDLTGAKCQGTASFDNDAVPAKAMVAKITSPVGFAEGWTFQLRRDSETGDVVDTATTGADGTAAFTAELGEGSYVVTETSQPGWTGAADAACAFIVDLPRDADTTFVCNWTNTYSPSVTLAKSGEALSKVGDEVSYTFTVNNTSPTGGAAGVPDLVCTVDDEQIGYASDPLTVKAGATASLSTTVTVGEQWADPFINTARVDCTYPGLSEVAASATSQHSLNLFQPSVTVDKTGPSYALVGDTVTYTVKITNTSSSDSPNLVMDADASKAFTDSLVSGVTVPDACTSLAPAASCEFDYTYVVPENAASPLQNTATVLYHPEGFPNDITGSDDHLVTILHPAISFVGECTTPNAPQGGQATFTVTVTNTGDAALSLTGDGGIGTFSLSAGASESFDISVDVPVGSPWVGLPGVTVDGSLVGDLTRGTVVSRSIGADSVQCSVGSLAQVRKTTGGLVDPSKSWTFGLYEGSVSGTPANPLATSSTSDLGVVDGVLDFGKYNLDPSKAYTVCELSIPAGWTAIWMVNGSVVNPYNPNSSDNPAADLGNRCLGIGAGTAYPLAAGGTLQIDVDNSYPGGEPRTIGYWKNWSSCSGGGQYDNAQKLGGGAAGYWTLDDLLNDPGFAVGNLTLDDGDCVAAVLILDKSDIASGKKKANDAAYELASQFLAAELNEAAGAKNCTLRDDAVVSAQNLLAAVNFTGTGNYLGPKVKGNDAAQRDAALQLAKTLDLYNNGGLCTG